MNKWKPNEGQELALYCHQGQRQAQRRSPVVTLLLPWTKENPRRTAPWYRPTTTLAAQLFGIEGSNNKFSILMVSSGCNLLVHVEDMILVLRVMKLV